MMTVIERPTFPAVMIAAWRDHILAHRTAKVEGYPLPWSDRLHWPYWRINFLMCHTCDAWARWQSKLTMEQIIPVIRDLLEAEA